MAITIKPGKTIGILGGMGPYATLMFMKNILDLTDAEKDWDHIRTVTDSNTYIPSRSRAILYNETSPLEGMLDSCKRLQRYPVDIIVIPCNSACFWVEELRKDVKTPVINIVNTATETLMTAHNAKRIAVLGGMVTYLKDLYRNSIERLGGEYVKHDEEFQHEVVEIIEAVKLQKGMRSLKARMRRIVAALQRKSDTDGVILACTEFTGFKDVDYPVPVVDSSSALARFVVDYAKHNKPLYLDTGQLKSFWRQRADVLKKSRVGILQSTMLTSSESEAKAKDRKEKKLVMDKLKPLLKKNGEMLELGCGTGRWSRAFAPFVKSIDAFDYSSDFIEIARKASARARIGNVHYHQAAIEKIQLDKQYDFSVSIALLHYLNDKQYRRALRLMKTGLVKGGLAVFRESFGYKKRFELHGFHSDVLQTGYHAVYRTSDEIAQHMGRKFKLIHHSLTLPPAEKKPETCQKILIFKKIA